MRSSGWASTPGGSWSWCARRRTSRSITGGRTRCSRAVLSRLGNDPEVHAVVLPRTDAQRSHVKALDLPSVIVPERAVEAQSLIALRRPRGLGRRDDESRGGGARTPGLHDLRGEARRRRRGADPLGPAAPAHRPRARWSWQARPRRGTRHAARPGAAGRPHPGDGPAEGARSSSIHAIEADRRPRRASEGRQTVGYSRPRDPPMLVNGRPDPIDGLFAFLVALAIAWAAGAAHGASGSAPERHRPAPGAQPPRSCRRRSWGGWRSCAGCWSPGSCSCPWAPPTRAILGGAVLIAAVGVIDDVFEMPPGSSSWGRWSPR